MLLSKIARTAYNNSFIVGTIQNRNFSAQKKIKEYDAKLILPCDNALGECPLWDYNRNQLAWLDCKKSIFWTYDPDSHFASSYNLPERPGSFAICEDGSYLFSFEYGPAYYDIDRQCIIKRIFTFEPGLKTRPNDGRVDRNGRFIFGGMMDPEKYDEREFISAVYRINEDNSYQTLFKNIGCSNSICFNLNGNKMYFADSYWFEKQRIVQYDYYDDDRLPNNEQIYVDCIKNNTIIPDGSIIDSDDYLWSSLFKGFRVIRYDLNGDIDTIVNISEPNATCATFGGKDLSTLFITTANGVLTEVGKKKYGPTGALYAINIDGVRGVVENKFKGTASATPYSKMRYSMDLKSA